MKKYIRLALLVHIMLCVTALTNEAYSQTYEVVEKEDGTRETWYYDSICGCWNLISIEYGPVDQDQDDDGENPDGGGDTGSDDQDDDDDWRQDDPYDDHDWQTHWWQDPWEDWIFVVGGGWTNNNSNNSPQCPELASRTLHGPLQSRIVIGIGEEVDFRIVNRCGATVQWDIENLDNPAVSLGELSNTTNDECKLQAFWQPGRIRITASLSNIGAPCQPSQCGGSSQELTIDMTIIEPDGISYAIDPPEDPACAEGYEHYENRPSAGSIVRAYAMPFHVNFYNVRFLEGEAEAEESGAYFANPAPWQAADLPQTPELNYATMPTATNQVYGGLGTFISEQEVYARFLCLQDRDPTQAGSVRWDIVQYYVNEGQSNTNHNEGTESLVLFDQAVQTAENAGGNNSLFTLMKTSLGTQTIAEVETNLEDPTSPCNFGNPPNECGQNDIFVLNGMNGADLNLLKIGNWEDSFDGAAVRPEFVSVDEDAFDVKVQLNENALDEIAVNVYTFDRSVDDPITQLENGGAEILDEIAGLVLAREDAFYMTQEPLLLVANDDVEDDNMMDYVNTPGVDESTLDGEDDGATDITIHAVPGGTVVVEYEMENGEFVRKAFGVYFEFESIENDEVEVVKLNLINILSNAEPPATYASPAEIVADIEKANEVLAQCGVFLVNSEGGQITEADVIVQPQPPGADLSNGMTINVISPDPFSAETMSFINAYKDDDDLTIDLFFVNYFVFDLDPSIEAPAYGYAIPQMLSDNVNINGTVFFAKNHSSVLDRPFVTAHEIGHILTNDGHYESFDFNQENRNLMRADVFDEEEPEHGTIYAARRLLDFQIEAIRNSLFSLPRE